MQSRLITHKLEENMLALHSEVGQQWLNGLPSIVSRLVDEWGLVSMDPVPNMTYSFVARTTMNDQPVVLKIGIDHSIMSEEFAALQYFNGNGAVKCLRHHVGCNALLLEQAIPGDTLKAIYPFKLDMAMNAYANVLSRLHREDDSITKPFRHVSAWLESINKANAVTIPRTMLERAKKEMYCLLVSSANEVVLHGDLHHDNIVLHEGAWVAIDPKGIIGEPEFEAAAFDFISDDELQSNLNSASLFNDRVTLLSEKSGLNTERLISWVYIRLVLSAVWFVEDNMKPDKPLNLIKRLF